MSAVTQPLPPAPDEVAELDELALARARRGDDAACRELVLRYQRPVFALLSRLLARNGRAALVEDLAQETFLRAFGALPGFDPRGPARLSTWLLTIAARLALDELKSRRPALEPLSRAEAVPSNARTDQPSEQRRIANRIALAVEALTPDQRAAFLLREAHGLSYEEVASALNVDLGTLKSRLSRARAALRIALEEPPATRMYRLLNGAGPKLDDALAASLGRAEADRVLDALTPIHMSFGGCAPESR